MRCPQPWRHPTKAATAGDAWLAGCGAAVEQAQPEHRQRSHRTCRCPPLPAHKCPASRPCRREGSVGIGGSIAYVAQSAWIMNDTLQENVLLGALRA